MEHVQTLHIIKQGTCTGTTHIDKGHMYGHSLILRGFFISIIRMPSHREWKFEKIYKIKNVHSLKNMQVDTHIWHIIPSILRLNINLETAPKIKFEFLEFEFWYPKKQNKYSN